MPLSALPVEILLLIGEYLLTESDIFALMRTNSVLYRCLLRVLYRENINHSGSSALIWCSMKGNEAEVKLLLEMHANIDCAIHLPGQSEWDCSSPIHVAASPGIAELLLLNGADVNTLSPCGNSPLHRAVADGNLALATFLLDKGANIDANGPVERSSICISHTALHLAVENRDYQMARLLVERDANLEIENGFRERPIQIAVSKNCDRIATLLANHGAELDCRNWLGETPLHVAARNGNVALCKSLLDLGAQQNALNKNQQTPLDIATGKRDLKLMELF